MGPHRFHFISNRSNCSVIQAKVVAGTPPLSLVGVMLLEFQTATIGWTVNHRRRACENNATALGLMYAQGRGVLQDFIQAHMWYDLSAAHGEMRSAEARDALGKQMTPAQVAEAQRLAREWKWKPREDKSRKTLY
jgi:TPR repeat protein